MTLTIQLFSCKITERRDNMNIHTYQSASGRDLIRAYIDTLTEPEQVDALSVLECMEKDEFDKIQFKKWQKRVYEVYFQKHNRLFYVVADSSNLYLLHACRKQKNKTEKKDKDIVIKRAKELGKELGKNFI